MYVILRLSSALSRRVGALQISIIIMWMSESHSAVCCSLRVSVWVSLWPAAVCVCQWVILRRSEVCMCIGESLCGFLKFICVSVSHSVAFWRLYVYQRVILWRSEVYMCISESFRGVLKFIFYQWVILWRSEVYIVSVSHSVAFWSLYCNSESFCGVLKFTCVSVSHSVAFWSLHVFQWVILWCSEVHMCISEFFCGVLKFICVSVSHSVAFWSLCI